MYDCCYQGLETLLQKDASSSISLISDGAECLFVSKKLFLEHANAKVLRVVSDLVSHVISHIAAESVLCNYLTVQTFVEAKFGLF